MKILLVLPPTAEKPSYPEPPAGLLYVASTLKRAGHEPEILDIYRRYISPEELSDKVRQGGYEAVGFGGITTCYGYVKEASKLLRERLPEVHLVAGGVLSSAHEMILEQTPIDVVCLREGEITAVNVMNRLKEGKRAFDDIKGLMFKTGGEVIKTPHQPYIDNLDDIPIPDYSLIDMDVYAFDAMKDPVFGAKASSKTFYQKGMRVFNMKTARGCTNACTFCYRHLLGYRQHSIDYVIRHIRHLQERYNIHFLRFGDELFTRNKEWVMELSRRLIEEKIDIRYIVHGVRTDNVDMELMKAIKDSGGVMVFIGFESGSQQMLDVMKKHVTVEQNIRAVRTILESGLLVLVQMVLAMPTESSKTIKDTIDTLLKTGIDPEYVAMGYAQAYPGTWLWQYALKNGIIKDKEKYLIELGESTSYLLNYTSVPWPEALKWEWQIRKALLREKYRKTVKLSYKLKSLDRRVFSFMTLYERYGLMVALKATVEYFKGLVRGKPTA